MQNHVMSVTSKSCPSKVRPGNGMNSILLLDVVLPDSKLGLLITVLFIPDITEIPM